MAALSDASFLSCVLEQTDLSYSDLRGVKFDGSNLTDAKLTKAALGGASFQGCVLDYTDFNSSDLSGLCFDNQTLTGTIFDRTGLAGASFRNIILRGVSFRDIPKKTIHKATFDGAKMDKLTYAVLKGNNADLTNVTVI